MDENYEFTFKGSVSSKKDDSLLAKEELKQAIENLKMSQLIPNQSISNSKFEIAARNREAMDQDQAANNSSNISAKKVEFTTRR